MTRTRLVRQPSQAGIKKLAEQHGAELFYVRNRYDDQRSKQYRLIEQALIVCVAQLARLP